MRPVRLASSAIAFELLCFYQYKKRIGPTLNRQTTRARGNPVGCNLADVNYRARNKTNIVRADPIDEQKPAPWQRVLLLQGPVGPAFRLLRRYLTQLRYHCIQVLFKPGDRLFSGRRNGTRVYTGGIDGLEDWLLVQASTQNITHMVLFGSERPVHIITRRVAAQLNIVVISLEEEIYPPRYDHTGIRSKQRLFPNCRAASATQIPN